ncbi:Ser/Thr protein kinase RdoA involved in Cpx stress response, MazF antagonist [Soonwooa buanensis]|uniref:Ser/Thr protein kinase RdoA involved in Cpx stress response, MazF antagonist n=1 Tax=Soonwooa buanensis TaxID=619805 RepID=A0A1T5EX57_9FLAO|nr:phosphotransferase [Soonwooa buanensis]SKB88310.1 Ser/Thr protein kinase RdoA involved in Cpx stress response, MazF antagonist [Soonwooa buanensis]
MKTFPVIASILSPKELGEFIIEQYQLNNDFECSLFRTGVNHTYFLSNEDTKYVIRVYCHNWRTKLEIQEELELLILLKKHNLSISTPIPNKNGSQILEIDTPEGIRYVVLFTFAKGEKMRFMTNETCAAIGSMMAKIHNVTARKRIDRVDYNSDVLIYKAYDKLNMFFSGDLDEMKYLKQISSQLEKRFKETDFSDDQKGIVHLDIWYDNLAVNKENEITIFDFDNCGNGPLVLDIGYFCKQLFFIEADKNIYESKVESFLNAYKKERNLSKKELNLIPEAGASIFIFYLGVQAQRFDWSNIFLTENYLKMFVGRIKKWLNYYDEKSKI